jgi:hypothetical protein
MNDPKYDVVDGRLWHREGRYFVPAEEPVMLLRGKDPVALAMIRTYLESGVDESHRASATERMEAFATYQAKYPERTKIGCHMHGEGQ